MTYDATVEECGQGRYADDDIVELFEAVRGGVVVHVRAATAEDLDFVVEANRALAEESESVALDVGTLRAGVLALVESRAPGRYWIAEIGGRRVGQLLITYEWSDWRNRMVWWVQSVYVVPGDRRRGVLRALYTHVRREAQAAGAGGLRLYVDTSNTRAQTAYAALGMKGDHYRVLEDMFVELPAAGRAARAAVNPKP